MEVNPPSNRISIVIIDDNPRSLEFLAAALSAPEVEILTTSKPEDGLALISLHRPQIVLTDLAMPGMSGLEILQKTRQLDKGIRVIVMSAHESGGSPDKAFEQGAADFLTKPIALSVLRQRVGAVIQKCLPDPH